ncbi:MAG: sugar transferase [Pseudomonadota bacterium]
MPPKLAMKHRRERQKRIRDIAFALAALCLLGLVLPAIAVLNLWLNRGPLFYRQVRMGAGQRPFAIIKLRTMQPGRVRGAAAPMERGRVTPFGAFLRAAHVDELPQAINILMGQMSLVGPRPDVWNHAVRFCRTVPGYAARHGVRPGLTGLAQVREGYCEGFDGAARKTAADLDYIASEDAWLDGKIVLRTVAVIAGDLMRWRGKSAPSQPPLPQN